MTAWSDRIPLGDLPLDRTAIGAAMGYHEIPPHILEEVERAIRCAESVSAIHGGYQVYDHPIVEHERSTLVVAGIPFAVHPVVFHQLCSADQIAVFVCTAGEAISALGRMGMREGDPVFGYICDVVGSFVVEAAMDHVQDHLRREAAEAGIQTTNRYSPGYCGWDVAEQKGLFRLLPAGFCGVHLSESALMSPIKSVSGFIGMGARVRFAPYNCSLCHISHCLLRRAG